MSKKQSGKCFCGAIEFEAEGTPAFVAYCHCNDCRTWLAAPINAFAMWPPDSVKLTKGADKVGTFSKSENTHRKFCKTCGGAVMTEMKGFGLVELFASLMPEFKHEPTAHVFYSEKIMAVHDGLPKFRDLPSEAGGSGETISE